MNKLNTIDIVALILIIVGGINWGLIGLADMNVVAFLGEALARIVYILVGLAAIYVAVIFPKLERK